MKLGNFKTNTECRICKSKNLKLAIDLGKSPLANAFLTKEEFENEKEYPLRMFLCADCNLLQMIEIVDMRELFSHYVYFTGVMPTPKHFISYAQEMMKRFIKDKDKEMLVEIGSNDGLLLKAFQEEGGKVLGVDPAENIAKVANERGIPTIPDFFGKRVATDIKAKHGEVKLIIGNNVVAHIDDHHDLLEGAQTILSKDGVFVLEAPYLVDMFENLTFDTIYHEHLSCLAVRPLQKLFAKYGMEIFDVQIFPVQGQSIRVFAGRIGEYEVLESVKKCVDKEVELGLDRIESYLELADKIEKLKEKVILTLKDLKAQGKKIAGYGAPAKGNTLLNYFKIGPDYLDFLTEELPLKIGKFSPGMHIPVISIADARIKNPDFYLMLAWNYKKQILEKEKDYLKAGHFIMPIGDVEII